MSGLERATNLNKCTSFWFFVVEGLIHLKSVQRIFPSQILQFDPNSTNEPSTKPFFFFGSQKPANNL